MTNSVQIRAKNQYSTALEMYWSGRSATALEYLTNLLSENPNHPKIFELYRLWIEIVAESKEAGSLYTLSTHLLSRSLQNKRKSNVYMALRGIIHLELDEMQATELFYETLKTTRCNNSYCAEFLTRYNFRFDLDDSAELNLHLESQNKYTDYLSLVYFSNHELTHGSIDTYQELAKKIQLLYPKNPILRLQQMHFSWDQEEYLTSINTAQSLKQQYPGNHQYAFSLGTAQLLNNDLSSAVESFTTSQSLSSVDDVDTSSLLACIYGYIAMNSDDTDIDNTAIGYINQAQNLLKEQGLPNNYLIRLEDQILDRNEDMTNEEPDNQPQAQQKVWLIQLTSREFSRIKTDSQEEVTDLTMNLGVNVLQGDIVLLGRMFDFDSDYQEMRVIALYEAVSDAYFDPVQNVCTEINLIHRPSSSITIPIESEDGHDSGMRRIYELDDLALEEISLHLEEKLTPEECSYWKESFAHKKAG